MANYWTQKSKYNIATLEEQVTTTVALPLSESNATVTHISGTLPAGMQLKNNQIIGTPTEVPRQTVYEFVLRASYNDLISDRTYKITVNGADEPVWETPEDLLAVGPNDTFYILDNSPIDFQLVAKDPDTAAGQTLEYYIGSGDGTLPPGIQLTRDGRLVGVVDPILAIEKSQSNGEYDTAPYDTRNNPYDYGIKSSNGFDSFFYDLTTYDLSIPTRSPKKLNRYYEFTVSVSDGDTIARRTFKIYVVGDDFLRVDNTIMQVSNGVFTADNTHIRTPIWLTPRNFGFRRANNYVTLFLDVLDPNAVSGVVAYTLERFNDDGTDSELPEGTSLDNTTGEVAGRVPYQPSVNKEYKFTVKASRYGPTSSRETVTIKVKEDAQPGQNEIKIFKNPDVEDIVGKEIEYLGKTFIIHEVDARDDDFDKLILRQPQTLTVFETAETGGREIKIFKLNEPYLDNLVNQTVNLYGQDVTISSVDYNLKTYRVRDNHTSVSFASDLRNEHLELVTGQDLENTDYWAENVTYSPGDIVKYNPDRFEKITIDRDLIVRVFAGISLQVPTVTNLTDLIRANELFDINLITAGALEVAESTKTFTVTLLGEVNSEINWVTNNNLGRISSNYVSTLKVEATSNVRNTFVLYTLIKGSLPPGLELSFDGSISGKVRKFGSATNPGITTIDTGTFTLDGNSTRIDRTFKFTVKAQDQYLYSAIEKEFSLTIDDPDNRSYSNLVLKPFLKKTQRQAFNTFISDPNIFDEDLIYRPFDPNFGKANEIKILVYPGIEQKTINNYVTAITKNHKRKQFKLGKVKTAVAKAPGTNNVVYEVVYVDVIDPLEPTSGKTRTKYRIDTQNRITVDESQSRSDSDNLTAISLTGRSGALSSQFNQGGIEVQTRNGIVTSGSENSFTILLRDETVVTFTATLLNTDANLTAPYTLPNVPTNLIKVDTDAVQVSQEKDQYRYISNLTNMRANIASLGITERNFLPLWMRTTQEDSVQELGYTPAIVLCYTKPGQSKIVANAVKNSNMNFKQFDIDVDRYVIDGATGNSDDQFLLFANYEFNI